jgi:hypothetical protein
LDLAGIKAFTRRKDNSRVIYWPEGLLVSDSSPDKNSKAKLIEKTKKIKALRFSEKKFDRALFS